MDLQKLKEKCDTYLNKIVHVPILQNNGSILMTALTLEKTKIVEHINMVLANFANTNFIANCEILFDKQDTKFVNIKSFVDSQDNPEMPS
jgi:hypothetical protein